MCLIYIFSGGFFYENERHRGHDVTAAGGGHGGGTGTPRILKSNFLNRKMEESK